MNEASTLNTPETNPTEEATKKLISKGVTIDNSMEEIAAHFAQDQFATDAGCRIVEARVNYAVCELPITKKLLNANNTVMGGAIFTLADFTMAVASNLDGHPTVSIDCSIRYFSTAKGTKLIATCTPDKVGRSTAFYTISIEDDLGNPVACMSATAHRAK